MNEMKVDFNSFNFNGLIDELYSFAEGKFNPNYCAGWLDEAGESPEFCEEKDVETVKRTCYAKLVDENKLIFCFFGTPYNYDPVECADGKQYEIAEEDNEEFEENKPGLFFNESPGYLLRIDGGKLIIYSAAYFMGGHMIPQAVNIRESIGVFEKPMEEFIKKFI